jgi:hypothetical protein
MPMVYSDTWGWYYVRSRKVRCHRCGTEHEPERDPGAGDFTVLEAVLGEEPGGGDRGGAFVCPDEVDRSL